VPGEFLGWNTSHVFPCFMALQIQRLMRLKLQLANIHRSPERVLRMLSLQMSVEAEAQGRRIQGFVKPSPERNWSRGWRHWTVSSIWSIPSVSSGWSVSSLWSQQDTRLSGLRGPISGGCLPPPLVGLGSASAEMASPRSKSWKIKAPPPSRSEKRHHSLITYPRAAQPVRGPGDPRPVAQRAGSTASPVGPHHGVRLRPPLFSVARWWQKWPMRVSNGGIC
jgi:hypothetical protein